MRLAFFLFYAGNFRSLRDKLQTRDTLLRRTFWRGVFGGQFQNKMKFVIKNNSKQNITTLSRKISYYFLGENKEKGEMIFSRPAKGYPRFHLYLRIDGGNLVFSLHLDQKKPIYKGSA